MKIPEIRLIAAPETEEAQKAIGFKYNDAVGFGHKIGGEPDFVQGANGWPILLQPKNDLLCTN